ncbi:MAG: hypothetical protein LC749_13585 [Actinobacteria bacterium]|nr:hypothetical protein [Actinomycetota bacterium]
MSTVEVATRHLVGLLQDLLRTAAKEKLSPGLSGVLLHSDHADIQIESTDDEGGAPLIEEAPSDVLIGTSTTTRICGQAHVPCVGRFHRLVLVSSRDADAIVDVFGPLVKSMGSETHLTEMVLSGDTLTVSEDPDQVPGGNVLSVHVMDTEGFPTGVAAAMEPDPHAVVKVADKHGGEPLVIPASYGTGVFHEHLAAVAAISKRRKMPIRWYRSHQRRGMVVEVGAWYRALLSPVPLDSETDEELRPQVPVFPPPFSAKDGDRASALVDF